MLAWLRTLRGRLVAALAVGVLGFVAALGFNEFQLRRIGVALRVVDTAYLPLARLAVELTARPDASSAPTLQSARRVVDGASALPADAEERAALQAILRQIERIEAEIHAPGATPARVRAEVQKLGRLVDARIASVSERTAEAQAKAERISLALLVLAVLLGASLLWLTGAALRPVEDLTRQVRRVAAGERPAPLAVAGDDEIATLARAFEQMTRAVEERDANLQALSLFLRRVLDSIGAAVAVAEGDEVRMANPAARALWGLSEGDRLPPGLGDLPEGHHAEVPAAALGVRREADEDGDGADAGVQDVAVRPFGERGRVLVGEDVTGRVRDRERLQRSQRLALVGQMLAQVTHEVRNPLNAMSLHAELLAEEVEGDEPRALLSTIQAEIRRLEDVTERYLDMARRRPPELEEEDPVLLARGVVALEEEKLRRAGVGVAVQGEPGSLVEVDGNAVRRALLNLVRNAAEAGARTIRVEVARAGGALELRVRDDGPGMEPDVAARVFDPFFSTRARGTGLGLAITRQIVEDLGGSIRCETAPGAGTTFVLTLPT